MNGNSFRGGISSVLPQTLQQVTVTTNQKLGEFFTSRVTAAVCMYFLLTNQYISLPLKEALIIY
jgi:hypothetical protein